jgi:hypothetical protein
VSSKDVARNHYGPLRSSLGSFLAETSFIGGSNLFVARHTPAGGAFGRVLTAYQALWTTELACLERSLSG